MAAISKKLQLSKYCDSFELINHPSLPSSSSSGVATPKALKATKSRMKTSILMIIRNLASLTSKAEQIRAGGESKLKKKTSDRLLLNMNRGRQCRGQMTLICRHRILIHELLLILYSFASLLQRGDGAMDSALACCVGGPGLIPAVGKAKQEAIQMVFLSA